MGALFFAVFFMLAGPNAPPEPVPTSMLDYKEPVSAAECKARVNDELTKLKAKDPSKHYVGGCINTADLTER